MTQTDGLGLLNSTPLATVADGLGPRQAQILERVQRNGFVSIGELAHTFSVTSQTVRRDINVLCGRGLLRRYHGGAGLLSTVENVAYNARRVLNLEEKRRIARLVAQHIPNQASLLVTLGTTTEEAARALADHEGLRVITNNINVAATLRENKTFEIMLTGGVVRARDAGLTGEATIAFIREFRVDYALIGISGIEPDGTLYEFDYREVQVLRAVIASSRKTYLLADHSKIGRNALVRCGEVADVDALFTDRRPPDSVCAALHEGATELHVPA